MSHVVLRKDGHAVGMAQLMIVRVPGWPVGMAYVNGGPMFRLKDRNPAGPHLSNLARALVNEYVVRRKYFLRIVPPIIGREEIAAAKEVIIEEGYSWSPLTKQTVIVDLSPSLAEIRRNMDRKWRQTLQSAEKKPLRIVEGQESEVCRMALKVNREMKSRKQFPGGNQAEAVKVHLDLPENSKLHFVVALDNQEPMAALGWVTTGAVGLPLVAATGDAALKTKASYVLWWRMVEYYKAHGFTALDMGGVNKRRNPGGYYFKTHILGKGRDDQPRYIGQFDACVNPLSRAFFAALFQMRERYRNLRGR